MTHSSENRGSLQQCQAFQPLAYSFERTILWKLAEKAFGLAPLSCFLWIGWDCLTSCLNWTSCAVSCLSCLKIVLYSRGETSRKWDSSYLSILKASSVIGTLVNFMFKSHSPSSWALLTKWTNLTKGNLEYQWLLRGNSEIPKLNFLKTKLGHNSSKISRTEWNAYFNWYFEASHYSQDSKIASPQNKILRLTEEKKWWKKDKVALKGSGSPSLASLSQAPPLMPSPSFPSMLPMPPLYPQSPHTHSLAKLPFSSEPVRTCFFKIKPSEGPEAKSLIPYTPWTKAELWAVVKDVPKVTKDPHSFAEEFHIITQTHQPGFSNLY